ncbi:hypothetical protein HGP13_33215 [Mesorhizobium sp. NZP2077]|uniref:hypothetical protein n=1 Tax=Mesorhizobium sp. NZP2077 TaxID=2483404 RepID=UPI001551FE60|nr:hypothetical protein [Mesorhizobium sp. NZP2077]QKD19449.1 hypothetical protein HGP13_33215 [Mesorhizobium sp. NZP2077]
MNEKTQTIVLTVASTIAIPIITVLLTAWFSQEQSQAAVDLQEFTEAYTMLGNKDVPNDARQWAVNRVSQYILDVKRAARLR